MILLIMILLEVILLMLILLVILILLMVFREVHVQFALRSKFSYYLPSFPLPSKDKFHQILHPDAKHLKSSG